MHTLMYVIIIVNIKSRGKTVEIKCPVHKAGCSSQFRECDGVKVRGARFKSPSQSAKGSSTRHYVGTVALDATPVSRFVAFRPAIFPRFFSRCSSWASLSTARSMGPGSFWFISSNVTASGQRSSSSSSVCIFLIRPINESLKARSLRKLRAIRRNRYSPYVLLKSK